MILPSITFSLLVLGLLIGGLALRKGRRRRKIIINPRWIVRKNKQGDRKTFFGVEVWNPTHSTYNPVSISFATRDYPEEEHRIVELFDGDKLPTQLKHGEKFIALLKDEELGRDALLGLHHLTVRFQSGKALRCDPVILEQFRSDYLAELKNPRPRSPLDWD